MFCKSLSFRNKQHCFSPKPWRTAARASLNWKLLIYEDFDLGYKSRFIKSLRYVRIVKKHSIYDGHAPNLYSENLTELCGKKPDGNHHNWNWMEGVIYFIPNHKKRMCVIFVYIKNVIASKLKHSTYRYYQIMHYTLKKRKNVFRNKQAKVCHTKNCIVGMQNKINSKLQTYWNTGNW